MSWVLESLIGQCPLSFTHTNRYNWLYCEKRAWAVQGGKTNVFTHMQLPERHWLFCARLVGSPRTRSDPSLRYLGK